MVTTFRLDISATIAFQHHRNWKWPLCGSTTAWSLAVPGDGGLDLRSFVEKPAGVILYHGGFFVLDLSD